jgi:NTP pyrophosphatase (non-canonical NTP hydrolase)
MTEKQFNEVSVWQKQTFGQATALSKLAHLLEEIVELKDELINEKKHPTVTNFNNIRMEFADCFLLIFGSASSYGFSYENICDAIQEKFEINKARKWGKPNENGVVKHVS